MGGSAHCTAIGFNSVSKKHTDCEIRVHKQGGFLNLIRGRHKLKIAREVLEEPFETSAGVQEKRRSHVTSGGESTGTSIKHPAKNLKMTGPEGSTLSTEDLPEGRGEKKCRGGNRHFPRDKTSQKRKKTRNDN